MNWGLLNMNETKKREVRLDRLSYAKGDLPVRISRSQVRQGSAPGGLAYHPEIEFQLIKRGKGAYLIDGKTYPFAGPSLLIIKSGEVHSFMPDLDSVVEKVFLMFTWRSIVSDPARFRHASLPTLLHPENDEIAVMDTLLRQMEMEMKRRAPFWQDIVRARIIEWLVWVRRISRRPCHPSADHPVQKQLLSYLESHFCDPAPIPKIAADFGYSGTYLTRLCKQFAGVGIKRYLLQRRIIEAQKLLVNGPQWTVAAIADRVGFSDFCLFNRAFKKLTGATPSEYRRIYHLHGGK